MEKILKEYGKTGFKLAGVGIGLSAATAAASGFGVDAGISKLSGSLPTIGGIYSSSVVIKSVKDFAKKSKY